MRSKQVCKDVLPMALLSSIEAFWEKFAKYYENDIKSGDMTPIQVDAFDLACARAGRQWIDNNFVTRIGISKQGVVTK